MEIVMGVVVLALGDSDGGGGVGVVDSDGGGGVGSWR